MTTTIDMPRPDVGRTRGSDRAQPVVVCTRRQALVGAAGALAVGAAWVIRSGDAPAHRITRGQGARTATGSIAVLGAHRAVRDASHAHGSTAPTSETQVHTWPDVVTADVELHNGLDRPLLASPGQLRLQVGRDGPTVSPLAAGFAAGPLAAGSTLVSWVSYLAPRDVSDLVLEYAELGARQPMVLVLPELHNHGGAR